MSDRIKKGLRFPLQILNYSVFMALVWYFSAAPSFQHVLPNEAMVALTFSHFGEHLEPCRRLTPEELAALPPNMRKPVECGRERSPIIVEALMDDKPLLSQKADPPGLYGDGGVDVFLTTRVPTGSHKLSVRMNDSVHVEGFNYTHEETVDLAPAQLLLIDFNLKDGFVLR